MGLAHVSSCACLYVCMPHTHTDKQVEVSLAAKLYSRMVKFSFIYYFVNIVIFICLILIYFYDTLSFFLNIIFFLIKFY